MYLWKCWRDLRGTFYPLLGAVLAVGAFGAYVAVDPFGWIAAKPLHLRTVWTASADALLGMMLGLVPWAGLFLGALGVGVEFEKGTADFLLTRPRSRAYYLWTSWGLGAGQVAALVVVSSLLQLARPPGSHRVNDLAEFLRMLAGFGTMALVLYGVTYLMTTLARNSRNGISLAILTLGAYGGLVVWLRLWYEVRFPSFMELYSRVYRVGPDFPAAVAGWLALSLALTLLAQWRIERAEV